MKFKMEKILRLSGIKIEMEEELKYFYAHCAPSLFFDFTSKNCVSTCPNTTNQMLENSTNFKKFCYSPDINIVAYDEERDCESDLFSYILQFGTPAHPFKSLIDAMNYIYFIHWNNYADNSHLTFNYV